MKFRIRKSKRNLWKPNKRRFYFVLVAANGETVMVSQMLSSKQNCYKTIDSICMNMKKTTPVIDETHLR